MKIIEKTAVIIIYLFSSALSASDGDVVATFNVNVSNTVDTIKQMPDGRILFGGSFKSVNNITRNGLARVNTDGSLDLNFNPDTGVSINPLFSGTVKEIALQSDSKILIGGFFDSVSGVTRRKVARINIDGSLDKDFNPNPNSYVLSIAMQGNNKIIIGGGFTKIGGINKGHIARLHDNGSLDNSFLTNINGDVTSIALQNDGKILVAGSFTLVNGVSKKNIVRLNTDGSIDSTFNQGVDGYITKLIVTGDGTILVGGSRIVESESLGFLVKLGVTGNLDDSFKTEINGSVEDIEVLESGKIMIGGSFTNVNGAIRTGVARLNFDGTLDTTFKANTKTVLAIEKSSENNIFIAGLFDYVGATARENIAMLENGIGDINISIKQHSRLEGDNGANENNKYVFDVIRSDNATGSSSVNYRVVGSGENAADEIDFGGILSSGVLVFAEGEFEKKIIVQVYGDKIEEPNETFSVELSRATRANIVTESATARIVDDDKENEICLPIKSTTKKVAVICL